jgi:hypothetical protein
VADDSIDVRLGATDDGLSAGLEGAAAQTEESTNAIAEAFASMRERVAAAMEGVGEAVRESLVETKAQLTETRESLEAFAEGIGSIQKTLALIGEVAMLGFVGEQIVEMVSKIGEYGEALEHARMETGMTGEEVQKLQYAFKSAGMGSDEAQRALMLLSRQMTNAQQGSKIAKAAFAEVGVSLEDLKNGDISVIMGKIADSFAHHADNASKAALAMQLFGRSGADLVPILDQGSAGLAELGDKAEQVGAVIGGEASEAMAKLGEHINLLTADASAAAMSFGAQLAPALNAAVDAIDRWVSGGSDGGFIADQLSQTIIDLTDMFIEVTGTIDAAGIELQAFCDIAKDTINLNWSAIPDALSKAQDQIAKLDESGGKALDKLYTPKQDDGDIDMGTGAGNWATNSYHPTDVSRDGKKKGDEGQLHVQEAINNALLANAKEHLEELKALYADQYANGLLSAQQYYAKLLEIQKSELDAERANKEANLKAANSALAKAEKSGDKSAVNSALAKQIDLKSQIAVLDQKLADLGPENARQEADAVRKLNEQLALTDISKQQNVGKSQAEAAKSQAEMMYATGQISKQQLTALEQQLQNDLYQIDMQALQQKLALYSQDTYSNSQKIAEVNAQIEQLEAQHQAQMTQLSAQAAEEQMASSKQATDDLEQGFEKAFASFADRSETARQAFTKFLTSIETDLTQLVSKDLFKDLFNMGGANSINSQLSGLFGKLFGGAGALGGTAQMTAQTANTTALTTLTAEIGELIASMQASMGGGLNSLLSSVMSGGGAFAGDFGFTAAGFTGSADAVAGGAMADSGGGMSALMGLASYDVGTPYVPTDQIAQIHKGEAIVPAHLNSPFNPNNVAVTNNFNLPGGGADLRTQSQIARAVGYTIQEAMRRA